MDAKLAVLSFDDAVSNHATFVAPLLKEYGFGATFYVTEYAGEGTDHFETDKSQYMTWAQIRGLDEAGFEVGNHTGHHALMRDLSDAAMTAEIDFIEERCRTHGVTAPRTFCYPCGVWDEAAVNLLRKRGYRLARTTESRAYLPAKDDPLLVPSFVIEEKEAGGFEAGLRKAEEVGGVAVFTLHGVPDYNHPWVTLSPERFREYMDLLKAEGWQVVAMRDLEKWMPAQTR
ncbi:MAG: polysaccharide deacetylase family protein [Opitutaceae bacterium]|jgi:peptidoglycan/xylan/chitin deacetylase (PgdA/CDA1 family)